LMKKIKYNILLFVFIYAKIIVCNNACSKMDQLNDAVYHAIIHVITIVHVIDKSQQQLLLPPPPPSSLLLSLLSSQQHQQQQYES
ncbi:hypothetical protein WUBG_18303, partial [Wuchereria bancrofti]